MELRASPHAALRGTAGLPGDKSVSHRALMFAALAHGTSRIEGLLEGEDVLATAAALRSLGVELAREDGTWRVEGRGQDGLAEPDTVLDLGNAGTGARLLMGILAGQPFTSILTGDASLRRRPMRRVVEPLAPDGGGVRFAQRRPAAAGTDRPASAAGDRLSEPGGLGPGEVGRAAGRAVRRRRHQRHRAPGLARPYRADAGCDGSRGRERARCGRPAPGHDPRRSTAPGAELPGAARSLLRGLPDRGRGPDAGLAGPAALRSAPTRCGPASTPRWPRWVRAFGFEDERTAGGEPVADLVIEGSELRGVEVPPERAPTMIDEYPVLAVAAAFAAGRTVMRGLAELRVKESDRLTGMAPRPRRLRRAGRDRGRRPDRSRPGQGGWRGADRRPSRPSDRDELPRAGRAGPATPVTVTGAETIETSFPGFRLLMNGLGARIEPVAEPG